MEEQKKRRDIWWSLSLWVSKLFKRAEPFDRYCSLSRSLSLSVSLSVGRPLLSVMSALHKLAGFITHRKLGEPRWWGPRSCCLFQLVLTVWGFSRFSDGSGLCGWGRFVPQSQWVSGAPLSLSLSLSILSPHSFSISNAYCSITAKAPRRSSSSSSSSSAYLLEFTTEWLVQILYKLSSKPKRETETERNRKHPRKQAPTKAKPSQAKL